MAEVFVFAGIVLITSGTGMWLLIKRNVSWHIAMTLPASGVFLAGVLPRWLAGDLSARLLALWAGGALLSYAGSLLVLRPASRRRGSRW